MRMRLTIEVDVLDPNALIDHVNSPTPEFWGRDYEIDDLIEALEEALVGTDATPLVEDEVIEFTDWKAKMIA
jgi:hypothetical protein